MKVKASTAKEQHPARVNYPTLPFWSWCNNTDGCSVSKDVGVTEEVKATPELVDFAQCRSGGTTPASPLPTLILLLLH